ncbi:MAG: 50S ribosomal protein L10 [Candidatus Shikimatogenerans bostrichidophilus]|nr:MAG: 50S ribosomal protein L10 [Candidatus Shikimatogenerans bostrichidophilus]
MNIEKKKKIIKVIKSNLKEYKYIYFIDISKFKSKLLLKFKKDCYNNNIKIKHIKNSLLKRIFKNIKKKNILFYNSTFIMFSKNINISAKIIKNNLVYINNIEYPIFKGALIEKSLYIGENLNFLINLKPKKVIILNIITLLKKMIINLLLTYKYNNNQRFLNLLKILINKNLK